MEQNVTNDVNEITVPLFEMNRFKSSWFFKTDFSFCSTV